MDLFTPIIAQEKQHPNFRHFLDHVGAECRTVVTEWAKDFVDRDGKFVQEFQTTCNSSLWELYVFACLKELGYKVDFDHAVPDFVATGPQSDAVFEAVIASNPQGYEPEWERDYSPETLADINIHEIVRHASIRLSQAISSKHKKYLDDYSKMEHVRGKPFVICVAPLEQPFYFLQNDNALRRVLFGFDQHLLIPDPEAKELRPVGISTVDDVTKDTGATVPLGFFTDDRMKEVSAVVFSQVWAACKIHALSGPSKHTVQFFGVRYKENTTVPEIFGDKKPTYTERLLDGLHVCLNPFAERPLDATAFDRPETAIHWYDPAEKVYGVRAHDGFLIQRQCAVIRVVEKMVPPEPTTKVEYKKPEHPGWPERELVSIGGEGFLHADFHFAHYRGWTIFVALDKTDNDWLAQMLKGAYFSVPQYMEANAVDEIPLLVAGDSYDTKEAALDAAIAELDRHEDSPHEDEAQGV